MGEKAAATAIRAAKILRNAGFRVELPATELKFGKALERASKLGSRFALILGENEVAEWPVDPENPSGWLAAETLRTSSARISPEVVGAGLQPGL